ncbi:MAG: AraC family transcriptional regulator [Ferruginibacter sp.]
MNGTHALKGISFQLLNVSACIDNNWNYPQVISPFSRIYLVKDGSGTIVHQHGKYQLAPGNLYIIPGFAFCNYSSDSFLDHYYVHFLHELPNAADIFQSISFKHQVKATRADFYLMQRLVELNPGRKLTQTDPKRYSKDAYIPYASTVSSGSSLADSIECYGIMLQLFSRFISTQKVEFNQPGLKTNNNISLAVNFIKKNLASQITISQLATECELSNDYFSKLFRATMGTGPIEYINKKRIEQAQLKLVMTNDRIETIALDIGIDNFSYFNRMFKRYSNITPHQYRIMHSLG